MTVGRELDVKVAESVMGYRNIRKSSDGEWRGKSDGIVGGYSKIPQYSRDIEAAFWVVGRIRETLPIQRSTQTFSFQLDQSGIPGGWHCSFVINEFDWSHQAYVDEAETAPLAICLAALKAVAAQESPYAK